MAITLAEAKVGMADKVVQEIIDEFRKGSVLIDALIFDDAVSPGSGGSTLTYGYLKTKTPSYAQFRGINEEYKPQEANREKASVDLAIFGGNFQIDRVLAKSASKALDEVVYQMKEKVSGAINLFHYSIINGDSDNGNEFDGLDKMLVGTATEYNSDLTNVLDISTTEKLNTNYQEFLDNLDEFISTLDGKPTMLLGNTKLITKIKSIARRAGYYSRTEGSFGNKVDNYDGIPLVDLENYVKDNAGTPQTIPCVPIETRSSHSGLTDLYAINISMDGFHGVTLDGNNVITTNLPNLKGAGVIKTGDVEMVAAVALKNSNKAGVFRNIKVM